MRSQVMGQCELRNGGGAEGGDRTRYLILTMDALGQLSFIGIGAVFRHAQDGSWASPYFTIHFSRCIGKKGSSLSGSLTQVPSATDRNRTCNIHLRRVALFR